jgi:hypothetical protein
LFIGVTNATRLGPWAGSRRKFNKYSQTKWIQNPRILQKLHMRKSELFLKNTEN